MKKTHLLAYSAAFGLFISVVLMTVYFWSEIPAQIPTHFGITGAPDAWSTKSIFNIMLVPAVQLLLILIFVLIYRHPQYSSWPTTLILMAVEEKKRNKIYEVLRGRLSGIILIVSAFLFYVQLSIIATANQRANGIIPAVIGAFLGLLFITFVFFSLKMYFTIHKLIKK